MDEWQKPDRRLLHRCNYIENVDKWVKKVSGRQELFLGHGGVFASRCDLELNLILSASGGLLRVLVTPSYLSWILEAV